MVPEYLAVGQGLSRSQRNELQRINIAQRREYGKDNRIFVLYFICQEINLVRYNCFESLVTLSKLKLYRTSQGSKSNEMTTYNPVGLVNYYNSIFIFYESIQQTSEYAFS